MGRWGGEEEGGWSKRGLLFLHTELLSGVQRQKVGQGLIRFLPPHPHPKHIYTHAYTDISA